MLLLLVFGCADDCATSKDGCSHDTDATVDSGDTVESGESGDTAPLGPCTVLGVEAEPSSGPVNNQDVRVTLDNAAPVEVTCALVSRAGAGVVLLPTGARWSYWDEPTVDPDWAAPDFDDSGWATGAAPLGYGEAVVTEIGYGPDADDKHPAAWFRGRLTVDDPSTVTGADVSVAYDDGAVVFVNGVEIGRTNLPDGELAEDTPALESIETTTERLPVDPSLLVAGENVLAVALHQSSPTTSDAWFDLAFSIDGGTEADPEERVHATGPAGTSVTVPVRGLLAEATYSCTVDTECSDPATIELSTGALPADLPAMSVEGAAPRPGYVLFNLQRPCQGTSQQWFVMVDSAGDVRWYDAADGVTSNSAMDIEVALLPDRERILWGGGESTDASPHLVDLDGEVLYEATYPGSDGDVYHHDVEYTAEGTILGLVVSRTRTDSRQVSGFDLVEHDPVSGAVVWEWSSQDAYDRGQLDANPGDDPWHANAFASVTDELGAAVYVNLYFSGQLIRIDKSSGDITHILGRGQDVALLDADGRPMGDDGWFEAAHGTGIAAPGRILQYDNGISDGASRVVVYEVDLVAMEARLVTEWSDGWYNPNWGDADELPDGGLLVDQSGTYCFGGTAAPGRLTYVDDAGEAVWRATFPSLDDASYRAQWIDGCDVFGNEKFCP